MNFTNLKNSKCLVILGYAGAGKDTVAGMVSGRRRGLAALRFSSPLKLICQAIFGWSASMLGDWAYKQERLDAPLKRMDGSSMWTRREALQYIGTDVFRQMDPEVWVMAALRTANHQAGAIGCDGFIATDCRFPNELEALKKYFGKVLVVRMVRIGGPTTSLQEDGTPHESERYIAEFPVDAQYAVESGDFDKLGRVADALAKFFSEDPNVQ